MSGTHTRLVSSMNHLSKQFSQLLLISGLGWVLATPAQAVSLWHADTVWAGQGLCAASFTVDSGGQWVQDLIVDFTALDTQTNAPIKQGQLRAEHDFGRDSATRYAQLLWEDEYACYSHLQLQITRAYAVIEGEVFDLLSASSPHSLHIRDFRPYQIELLP